MSADVKDDFMHSQLSTEVFSTRLYRIERLGSCRRLIFATGRTDKEGLVWLEPAVSVVVPAEAISGILKGCAGSMALSPIETAEPFTTEHMRPN